MNVKRSEGARKKCNMQAAGDAQKQRAQRAACRSGHALLATRATDSDQSNAKTHETTNN